MEIFDIKVIFGKINGMEICYFYSDDSLEDVMKTLSNIRHPERITIKVRNSVNECIYDHSEFKLRYYEGQRHFVKSNHPTFRRWRNKRRLKDVRTNMD